MIMIVYHHFYVHGNWEFPEAFSKKAFLIQTLGNYGRIGVIIFILITCYFMTNQTFRMKKSFCINKCRKVLFNICFNCFDFYWRRV